MNDYPTIEQPQSLNAPSPHNLPEAKPQGYRKCRDYFEYRHIPQENNLIAEPEIDYPDFEKERVEAPIIQHKEPVSAPMPEHSNFFSGVHAQPNESVARISVIPESVETNPSSVKRTYYIPSGPRESLQPQVYYFQNTSPPESFFHENKTTQVVHSLQTRASYTPNQIRSSHTPVHVRANSRDLTVDIHRKFQVINGLNRIESEIKALAIEQKNQEILNGTMIDQSHLQVEEKVNHLNKMLAMKNDLAKYQAELETITIVDDNEKQGLRKRIDNLKNTVEYHMTQKKISFTQNLPGNTSLMKMSESIVSVTGNVQPRKSYSPISFNQEPTTRIISRSVNMNRAPSQVLKPVQFVDYNGLRTSNFRQSITINEQAPVISEVPVRRVYAQNVEKAIAQPPSIEHLHVEASPVQVIQAAPQVVRYSYNPNQLVTETVVIQQALPQEPIMMIEHPMVILPLSKIQESVNENYESAIQKSNTVIQRFSYNPIMTDSEAIVANEFDRTVSGKKIMVDVATVESNQQSIKIIEKESLGPEQQYSMTNAWPDGYEFYDEPSNRLSEKIVDTTN